MNLTLILFATIGAGLLYWFYQYNRKMSLVIEQSGYHAVAIVKSYHKEYVRVAGSWNWLDYPYVEYRNEQEEMVFERLKYAESNRRLLSIGDEIEVVRYNGVLYYRAALHLNYEWSYILWIAATVGALAAIGGLASYFTSSK